MMFIKKINSGTKFISIGESLYQQFQNIPLVTYQKIAIVYQYSQKRYPNRQYKAFNDETEYLAISFALTF